MSTVVHVSVNRISSPRRPSVFRTVAVLAALSVGAAACSSDENDAITTTSAATSDTSGDTTTTSITPSPMGDVVATALTNQVFTELAGLAVDAGLVDALRGGPFTVFAPTDMAFAKLPLDLLHAVQDQPELLTTVLTHHVVEGAIAPDEMVEGELTTLAGTTLTVTKVGDQFYVDGNPVGAGVEATNGYVYVMSDVLVPAVGTITDVAVAFKDCCFGTLVTAVTEAALADTLAGEGPFTVFAPADAAFEAMDQGTLNAALADPSGLLTSVLLHHVIPGKYNIDQLPEGEIETALGNGDTVEITKLDGKTFVDGVEILVQNVQASNGTIHVIGEVLLPG
jgi:transforming growth factor-beta-induced protein